MYSMPHTTRGAKKSPMDSISIGGAVVVDCTWIAEAGVVGAAVGDPDDVGA